MRISFKELNYLVTSITLAAAISKTIIFSDNIDTVRKIAIHFQGRLSAKLRNKTNILIQIFFANLTVESWTQFFEEICNGNIYIWIYTKCTNMGLNLCNIQCV